MPLRPKPLLGALGQAGMSHGTRGLPSLTHAWLQAVPSIQRPAAPSSLRSGFWQGVDVPGGFALAPSRLCLEELWSCGISLSNSSN